MTHYTTLGVAETATADEIKRAYRKLASQHHPDRGGDTATFQAIQAAYDTVGDETRRQQYDLERTGRGMPGGVRFTWHTNDGSTPHDMNEVFRHFGFGGPNPFQQQRRNKDLRIEVPVTLDSTLESQNKTISVQTTNGHRETMEITIPRGITSGTNIKYSGLGDNMFNTLARGDLYIQITVLPRDNFIVSGVDVVTSVTINCLMAIVGGEVIVNGLTDKLFSLNIPPGTQSGTKFRFPQQGLYQLNGDQRGDLYVDIRLSVPQNLPNEQLDTIKSLLSACR
jgi:DnaJ-class molecular chaperone